MTSTDDKPVEIPRSIGHKKDSAEEVCCFICVMLLLFAAFVGGGSYLGVTNPEAAVATLMMFGLPALCLTLLFVAWQIRKIAKSME